MKFTIAVLLTALVAFAGALYLPWWFIAVAGFIVAVVVQQKPGKSFLAAFIGLFLLWFFHAMVIDSNNNHLLSTKVAGILPLGNSFFLLLLVTALIGALVAGMAALTGSYLRSKPAPASNEPQ